jgi:hypothetical protein
MPNRDDSPDPPAAPTQRCPICGKPASPRFRPFCSARCQTIDLARWIGGNYRVPTAEEESPSDDDEVAS